MYYYSVSMLMAADFRSRCCLTFFMTSSAEAYTNLWLSLSITAASRLGEIQLTKRVLPLDVLYSTASLVSHTASLARCLVHLHMHASQLMCCTLLTTTSLPAELGNAVVITAAPQQQQTAHLLAMQTMVQLQSRIVLAVAQPQLTDLHLPRHLAAGRAFWQVLECLAWLGAVREITPRHIAARQSTRQVTCKQRCLHWASGKAEIVQALYAPRQGWYTQADGQLLHRQVSRFSNPTHQKGSCP